jgi:hypothetical protein
MKRVAVGVAVALLVTAPVKAKEKPLDPKTAYVLVDIGDLEDALMKGAAQPGGITLGRYDPVKRDIRGGELSPDTALPKTESPHLAITKKPVAKGEGVRQYLVEIPVDMWVVEGANGTAFSLGSVQFEIKPGEVVDLGVLTPMMDWAPGEKAKSVGSAMMGGILFGSMRPKNLRPVLVEWHARTAGDLPLPPQLGDRQAKPVAFVPGAKFGNYLGGLVNRMGGRPARFKELAAEQAEPSTAAE